MLAFVYQEVDFIQTWDAIKVEAEVPRKFQNVFKIKNCLRDTLIVNSNFSD